MSNLAQRVGDDTRARILRDGQIDPEAQSVVYWMQRSQRGRENPALDLAIRLANELSLPVLAVFGLTASYPGAQRRHYRFLVDALPEIHDQLATRGVPLIVRLGEPDAVAAAVAREARAAAVIGDENPLKIGQVWRNRLAESIAIPFACVDADVVVPSKLFPREEYAARTLRPKIHKVLDAYLVASTNPSAEHRHETTDLPQGEPIEPDRLLAALKVGGAGEVAGYRGGPGEAQKRLRRFVTERLPGYATERNEPIPYHTSELSAHLHFGHISPVTMALAARESDAPPADVDSFLEELIVRRELSVNFVARNANYDCLEGCPGWALETLRKHATDQRPYLYDSATFEAARTHDPIWNAAQREMVLTGRMHNYLRMYWAKKILEWSPDAATAFAIAIDLNDRYEMDGRDPNGYTGVAWAIGGKHDRPWPERPIYGTVRTMTANGIRGKLNIDAYIRYVQLLDDEKEAVPRARQTRMFDA